MSTNSIFCYIQLVKYFTYLLIWSTLILLQELYNWNSLDKIMVVADTLNKLGSTKNTFASSLFLTKI